MTIEVEQVGKRFGRKAVLDDLSFSVQPGEIVALAGANGAGKSTVLALLMGFLEIQGGTLRVLGHDPSTRRHLAEVGFMPEQPAFPDLRIEALLRLRAGTFPSWDDEHARGLLERLEIDPQDRPRRMSRGERARLALLFALAHRPRLLLLDDPTLGLDPAARRLLVGEVLADAAEGGAAVLMTTHLLAETERALDRLLILRSGRIVFDRRVDETDEPLEDVFEKFSDASKEADDA